MNSKSDRPDLSAIVPVWNEAGVIGRFNERLATALDGLSSHWEILYVDDGSSDGTIEALRELAEADPRIGVIRLSRNFGKEAAVCAGLGQARGELVATLDGDLQHPPEALETLHGRLQDGADIVHAVRADRRYQSRGSAWLRRLYYWLFNFLSDIEIPNGISDFRIFRRPVLDAVLSLPEREKFLRGLFVWVGFRQAFVEVGFDADEGSGTGWTVSKLIRLAFSSISAFSSSPLRIWTQVGVGVALLGFAYALYVIGQTIILGKQVPGFATLVVIGLSMSGMILMCLGTIGEYLALTFDEVKRRPAYLVAERLGRASQDEDT